MPFLALCAAELDALERDGRRIRLGDRNPETPYEALDELLGGMRKLADRMRAGAPVVAEPANDHGQWQGPTVVITGRAQILRSVARKRP